MQGVRTRTAGFFAAVHDRRRDGRWWASPQHVHLDSTEIKAGKAKNSCCNAAHKLQLMGSRWQQCLVQHLFHSNSFRWSVSRRTNTAWPLLLQEKRNAISPLFFFPFWKCVATTTKPYPFSSDNVFNLIWERKVEEGSWSGRTRAGSEEAHVPLFPRVSSLLSAEAACYSHLQLPRWQSAKL